MDQQKECHDLVAHLTESEELNRANERTAYYLKLVKFRLPASVNQIECSPTSNFTRQQLAVLAEGCYLQQGENILITGTTGCGKSILACAKNIRHVCKDIKPSNANRIELKGESLRRKINQYLISNLLYL